MVSLLLCFWCPNSDNRLLCSLNFSSVYDWEEIASEQLNSALLIFRFGVFPNTTTTKSNTNERSHTLLPTASLLNTRAFLHREQDSSSTNVTPAGLP